MTESVDVNWSQTKSLRKTFTWSSICKTSYSSAAAGCHHEGLSAPQRGGDVQVGPGGGGALGHHGVSAGWRTDQHCVGNQVESIASVTGRKRLVIFLILFYQHDWPQGGSVALTGGWSTRHNNNNAACQSIFSLQAASPHRAAVSNLIIKPEDESCSKFVCCCCRTAEFCRNKRSMLTAVSRLVGGVFVPSCQWNVF